MSSRLIDSEEAFEAAIAEANQEEGLPSGENEEEDNFDALKDVLKNMNRDLPWIERLDFSENPVEVDDFENDIERESVFIDHALTAVHLARARFHELNVPFDRPADYFCEMLKSDQHMQKIKEKLIFEERKMEAFEKRKENQKMRKFAKQVKAHQQEQRDKSVKDHMDSIKAWRTSSSKSDDGLERLLNKEVVNKKRPKRRKDEEDEEEDNNERRGRGGGRGGNQGGPSRKRQMKNKKFGTMGGMPNQVRKRLEQADMLPRSARRRGGPKQQQGQKRQGQKEQKQQPKKRPNKVARNKSQQRNKRR